MKNILNCISFTDMELYKINIYKLQQVENAFPLAFIPFVSVYNTKENKGVVNGI